MSMKLPQLKKIKRSIENFFYKIRFNIALNNILKTKRHLNLRDDFKKALKKQLRYYSTEDRIDEIRGVKKTEEIVNPDLHDNLLTFWIPILAILDSLDRERMRDYYYWVADQAGQAALDKLHVDQEFHLRDKAVKKRLDQRVSEMMEFVDETTQEWLVNKVRNGLQNDLSSREIAKLVRDSLDDYVANRADLIAEHETAFIFGQVELEVYKKSGIEYHKWRTQRDELVCEICWANEAAGTIQIGNPFPNGVTNPPAHFRCRCFVLPILDKEVEEPWLG